LIQCSIIEPQFYANKYTQLLRMTNREKSINSQVTLNFASVQYLGLSATHLQSIRIILTDEHMIPLKSFKTPTTVLLHFRKIY
jgi:hypothetical protein